MAKGILGKKLVISAMLTGVLCVATGLIGLLILSLSAGPPRNLGVRNGRLAACPVSPNCVCTQAEDQEHWIAPLNAAFQEPNPLQLLEEVVREMPRVTVVESSNDYLRVEFRSLLFRFCDDVEFFHEVSSGRIHFRSASRVGYSDLGVNRQRMEEIRARFLARAPRAAEQQGMQAPVQSGRALVAAATHDGFGSDSW